MHRLPVFLLLLAAAAPASAQIRKDVPFLRALWQAITQRCDAGKRAPFDPRRWELVWADEFNGGDGSSCYTRKAQCQAKPYWGPQECPPETQAQLAGLNKCVWSVFHYQNYMSRTVNNFSAKDVAVRNGYLVLTSRERPRERVRPSGRPCGAGEGGEWNSACEFSAGGVETRPLGSEVPGFTHKFGRWEVRAKLPAGEGSWPAHWMMPHGGDRGWPADGEIDIMESFANPNRVAFTLHWKDGEHQQIGQGCNWPGRKTFADDFHVYAVEWEPTEIRFYVDDRHIGSARAQDRTRKGSRVQIPQLPFFWILNTSIAEFSQKRLFVNKKSTPTPGRFPTQEHLIDYVRVYRRK